MTSTDCESRIEGSKSADNADATEKTQLVHKDEHTTNRKQLIAAVVALILALIGGAAIGPCFRYIERAGITPFLAVSWRCQCMLIFLLPTTVLEYRSGKNPPVDWFLVKPGLYFPLIVHVAIAGFLWAVHLLCWIEGLKYTTAYKASLFVSSSPMMLVVMLWFLGTPASWLEAVGVVVAFGGMIVSCMNSSDASGGLVESQWHEYLGYILCFFAAIFETLPMFNRQTIKYVPLMLYTTVTTAFVAVVTSIFAVLFEGTPETGGVQIFCRADSCIFGWTSSHWVMFMLVFGFTVGVVCIAGFNYAILHIPPLIFSSAGLVDPFLTALISYGLGVDALPTPLTWLGGVIVMGGLGTISLGDQFRSEKEKTAAEGADGAHGTRSRAGSHSSRISIGEAGYMLVNSAEDERSSSHGGVDNRDVEMRYGSLEKGESRK